MPKKTTRKSSGKFIKSFNTPLAIALIVAVAFGAVGTYNYFRSDAAPKGSSPKQQQSVSLAVSPASSKVNVGDTVSVQVWVDSLNESTTAVQANLTYPTSAFQFVAIDDTNSAFGIAVQAVEEGGVIKIARGNFEKLTGKQLVATVNLRAIAKLQNASVKFTTGSEVINAATYQNMLATTVDAKYNVL